MSMPELTDHSLSPCRNFQGTILLIVMSLAITLFYGLWIANIGTAYRMRVQVWLFWAIFGFPVSHHTEGCSRRTRLGAVNYSV